jgi:hypothetical protein
MVHKVQEGEMTEDMVAQFQAGLLVAMESE